MYTVRFYFLTNRALDFLPDFQTVSEMEFTEISDIVQFVQEFADSLEGTLVLDQESNNVVDLNKFKTR